MKNNRRQRSRKPVNYNGLEDRRLLAVTAYQSGSGEVVVGGDALGNHVVVQQVADNLRVDVVGQGSFNFDFASVTSLRFVGRAGNDIFNNQTNIRTIAAGNAGNDQLISGNGNDRLFGDEGNDTLTSSGGSNVLHGAAGNDTITGGSGLDTIFAFGGDDIINSGGGDDYIVAGDGDDTVNAGDGDDTVFASAGDDTVHGDNGNDKIYGQADVDMLFGDDGNDLIRGGTGNDTLTGGIGDDRALGEDGNDEIRGNDGRDTIFGGDGADMMYGDDGFDFLYGGLGNDTIRGGNNSDQIRGNEGNDDLYGDNGNDRVAGDDGDDFLDGGNGADTILGDAGADEIIGTTTDFVRGGAGDDLIGLGSGGGDTAAFLGNYANFVVTETGPVLYVRDTSGNEGLDAITGANSIRFNDQTRAAKADVNKRVFIQPIIVSNSNGSNTAEFLGNSEQELTIKRLIDEIYLQANVDIEWATPRTWNNSFANVGNSTPRPTNDLNTVVSSGDSAGVGNSDPIIIDAYFVEISPGFGNENDNVANGLAFVDSNGTTIHVGDNLPTFANGRGVVSRVVAHEIAHNLGLDHVSDPDNLMANGDEITPGQRSIIQSSQFSVDV